MAPLDSGSKDGPANDSGFLQQIEYYSNKFDRLNASWTGTWWYPTVHNITAIVGAGVLGLPSSIAYLTWYPGITAIVFIWILSLVTYWQMTQMYEHKGTEGITKFDQYHELGQYIFGPKLGLWLVIPSQIMIEVGVDIVYMVTAGKSIQYIAILNGGHLKLRYCIIIFASAQFVLCPLREITSITWISIIAAITAVCYATITWAVVPFQEVCIETSATSSSTTSTIYHVFSSLGQIAFALAGHNVVLEIQATIPSTEEKPSKIAMWRGGLLAYIVIAICYLPTATICYWRYQDVLKNHDNMLLLLVRPGPLITMANAMLVLHMVGSYQIYAMPFFNKFEEFIEKKFHVEPRIEIQLIIRILYVSFTSFIALSLPFFGELQGFIGGIAYLPSTYVLPCLMWHLHRKPKPFSLHWIGNMALLISGVSLMVLSTVGGLYNIITKARHFDFDWGDEVAKLYKC